MTVLAGCPRPMAQLQNPTKEGVSPQPNDATIATRLATGDMFDVSVYNEPELKGTFRVGATGTVDYPLCGRINVAGKTTEEVAFIIESCLKNGKMIKFPSVTVMLKEVGGSKKIVLYGLVAKPGHYPFEDGMTIIHVIALGGGFTQFAAQNSVSVTRRLPSGESQVFKVAVGDIGTGKAPNFYMLPGDQIFVPESPF